jgi:hypothetical protein
MSTSQPRSSCLQISRPEARRSDPPTWVHGLVQCNSDPCKSYCGSTGKRWNWDVLAVSNFRRIWNAYMEGLDRRPDLRCQQQNAGGGAGNHGNGWYKISLRTAYQQCSQHSGSNSPVVTGCVVGYILVFEMTPRNVFIQHSNKLVQQFDKLLRLLNHW